MEIVSDINVPKLWIRHFNLAEKLIIELDLRHMTSLLAKLNSLKLVGVSSHV